MVMLDNSFSKHGIHKSNISERKHNILTQVHDITLELSMQPRYNTFSELVDHFQNSNLQDIQENYVIKKIDKFPNNSAFIFPFARFHLSICPFAHIMLIFWV